jgi:hypothetical protein
VGPTDGWLHVLARGTVFGVHLNGVWCADLADARSESGGCWRGDRSKIRGVGELRPATASVPSGASEGGRGRQPAAAAAAAVDTVGEGVYEGLSTGRVGNTSGSFWTAGVIERDQDERPGPHNSSPGNGSHDLGVEPELTRELVQNICVSLG